MIILSTQTFKLLRWEKTNTIHPSSLEDRSSAPLKQSSTLELEKSICTSPQKRYAAILLTLTTSLKNLSRSESDATATRGGKSSKTTLFGRIINLFLYFHIYRTGIYLFYFYATTVNVLMGFMPRAYSHGAYYF